MGIMQGKMPDRQQVPSCCMVQLGITEGKMSHEERPARQQDRLLLVYLSLQALHRFGRTLLSWPIQIIS